MKASLSGIFLSLATYGLAASVLVLGGCTTGSNLPQKQASGQTATYSSPYGQNTVPRGPNGLQGYGSSQGLRPAPNTVISTSPLAPVPVPGMGQGPGLVTPGAGMASQAAMGKIKVAILLPLTGKNAGLGQAMLNAAQQAVFDAAGTNFELQPHDTAGEGGAEGAARAAVSGGVKLIIGPLFATDIPAVMTVAGNAGLQMLALSTDTSLAQRNVFVMGLAPGTQVERVIGYATAHGVHRFAALIPSTPYGSLVGQIFQNVVNQDGGDVVDFETYDPAVLSQLADRAKQIAMQKDHIDAIFLPEAGNDLKTAADQLTAAGLDTSHVKMIGTGLWDVPALGHQSNLLIGGWYAAPDPAARRNFMASYAAAYGQEPPRIATLAYDATALAAVIAKRGGRYDETALTNPNGFAGLDGIFRLSASGTVERALAVNEVTPEGARVIDPSPTSFVGNYR